MIEILGTCEEFNKATILSWQQNGEGFEGVLPSEVEELVTLALRSCQKKSFSS